MTGIRLASRRAAARARLSLILLALVALACLLATLPLSLLSGQLGYGAVAVVIGIPCAAVGVVVARRQPGNPLGWLFLMTGILLLISNDAGDYAYYVYRLGHRLPFGPAALVIDQLWDGGPGPVRGDHPALSRRPAAVGVLALGPAGLLCPVPRVAGRRGHRGGRRARRPPGPHRRGRRPIRHRLPGRLVRRRPAFDPARPAGVVGGLHRPPGAELASLVGRTAPAAEVAGERRSLWLSSALSFPSC